MNYLSKKFTHDYRALFNDAFLYVQTKIDDLSFYYRLIGSAKRNLVLEKPNKGFDFDYQVIFFKSLVGLSSTELIEIKRRFRLAFDDFFCPLGYKNGEDSRSAITIKKLDYEHGKIHHSYDITLLSPSSEEDNYIHIMRYEDEIKTIMTLNKMGKSVIFNEKYQQIHGTNKWQELRDIYKYKQEKWNGEKKSFSLLMEAVNEIKID